MENTAWPTRTVLADPCLVKFRMVSHAQLFIAVDSQATCPSLFFSLDVLPRVTAKSARGGAFGNLGAKIELDDL
jgi:hypothetical protein